MAQKLSQAEANFPLSSSVIPCQSLIQRDIETTMLGGLNL